MLSRPLAFIDLETTGMTAARDRVTEVGVVRVECGHVVEEWSTLVNPGCPIPAEIQGLTGITSAMVADAPPFEAIADEVRARLEGAVFVAHNARFDFGFIKHEYARLRQSFTARVLCTAKLSRRLYPEERRHNLDALVDRHRLPAEHRHRALGDARLLFHFLEAVERDHPAATVEAVIERILKTPSLPPQLPPDALSGIPDEPGVYFFYGLNELPLYIGKSIGLRDRVASHFSGDYRNANDLRLSSEIQRIEWRTTAGELGALLLEARLIRDRMPLHNRQRRRHEETCALVLESTPGRPRYVTNAALTDPDSGLVHGPFSSRRAARESLRSLADEHGLCWSTLGLERRDGPCFARQLHRCAGACVGAESLAEHHARLLAALAPHRLRAWPVNGAAVIVEMSPDARRIDLHVVDRWRWLGTVAEMDTARALARVRELPAFDLDGYRILAAFIDRESASRLEILDPPPDGSGVL